MPPISQRVALLQVWKNFEEKRGTSEDVARVQGMMPIQGKRRYVDEETGQLVEGASEVSSHEHNLDTHVAQITITFSPTTSARPTRPPSSSSKMRTPGRPRALLASDFSFFALFD